MVTKLKTGKTTKLTGRRKRVDLIPPDNKVSLVGKTETVNLVQKTDTVNLVPPSDQLTLVPQPIRLKKQKKISLTLTSDKRKRLKEKIKLAGEEIGKSKQSRFSGKQANIFQSTLAWVQDLEQKEVVARNGKMSNMRDEWLAEVVKREPFLNSVLSQVTTIDKNRGWNVTGGKRYVQKVTDILHNIKVAPDLFGWRPAMSMFSKAHHCADVGCVIETEFYMDKLAALYPVDPTKVKLTGDNETPLEYLGLWSGEKLWKNDYYIRIPDNPRYEEAMYGLGECAVSRAIELAKIMIALWQHDKEKLLSTAPRGLLLLKGISEQQWDETLEQHAEEMSELERRYYHGVQILATEGLQDIDARILSLSEVPEGISQESFTNLLMTFYALAFKYDPREFWPYGGGTFGTTMETAMQHKKATQKGGMDFILALQEKLQNLFPQTVDFEFEQRDTTAEMEEQNLKAAIISNIVMLTAPVGPEQKPLISVAQALNMLAAEDIIPQEWTELEEIVTSEDTDDNPAKNPYPFVTELIKLKAAEKLKLTAPEQLNLLPQPVTLTPKKKEQLYLLGQQLRLLPSIERSLYYAPNEPIVRYNSLKNTWVVVPTPLPVKRFYSIPE